MRTSVLHKSPILILDNYSRHQHLQNELLELLENYSDVQFNSTNVKATMTEWNISSPEIESLKKFILENSFQLLWPLAKPEIINFWANIYRKGDYTEYHNHNPYILSFVYFLKCKRYFSPLIFDSFLFKRKLKPKEGRLIIFPSYLVHGVPKHKYDETRITLSGNITLPSDVLIKR